MRRTVRLGLLTAAVTLWSGMPARAAFTIDIDSLINGDAAQKVNNALPFAKIIFETTAANQVTATFDASNLVSSQFVSTWLVNYNGNAAADISGIVFKNTEFSGAIATGVKSLTGGSQVKAGLFNLQFTFNTPNNLNRFNGGEVVSIDLLGTGLTEDDFNDVSLPDGANPGGWASALEVQGIPDGRTGGTTSGSLGGRPSAVPEPTSVAFLGGIAVLGLQIWRRRRA